MTTAELVKEIRLLQNIQKSHAQSHPAWTMASKELAPRFAEMAKRVERGDAEAMAARL